MASRAAERVLVTSALPYADGPIHFGHVVGAYLPADIYVRFRRQRGDEVLFICGTDEHGVAVTLHAEEEGVPYQEYVDRWHDHQETTFRGLGIQFDVFSGTSAGRNPHHAPMSQEFFTRLREGGYIRDREEEQLFCGGCRRFLADRYVEGSCPRCGSPNARGDECPACGSWLDVKEVLSPRCKVCGAEPRMEATRHWYLDLARLRDERIGEWFRQGKAEGRWKPNVERFVEGMLGELRERPVTRDLPWGVPVPLPEAGGKVLYVWFEAPIGYVSITRRLLESRGDPEGWRRWWQDPGTELVHFIGKDNIAFHMVVFPAMLHGVRQGYVLPANVPANEFFNLEGRKFNKSEGWYIDLGDFLSRYHPDAARYALLASMPETADTDFLWREFQQRVNGELADSVGNLVTRTLRFTERSFAGTIPEAGSPDPAEKELFAATRTAAAAMEEALLGFSFRRAAAAWVDLSRAANRYYDQAKPWETVKSDRARCAASLRACAEAIRSLAVLGAPLIPQSAQRIWEMLGLTGPAASCPWSRAAAPGLPPGALRHGPVEAVFAKVPDEQIQEELARLQARAGPAAADTGQAAPSKPTISHEDFAKLDLRIGTIRAAEKHPQADRLLRLEVDLGGERRQIIAGIAQSYRPEDLLGRRVVVLANLAPRKLRGLASEGMVLAAGAGGKPLLLVPDGSPPEGAPVT